MSCSDDAVGEVVGEVAYPKMEPVVKELPANLITLVIDRPYDLDELMQEVTDEMFEGSYEGICGISWTTKPLKHYSRM